MSLDEALQHIESCRQKGGVELDLSGLELSEVPDALVQLTNLQTLYLGGNQLSEVPDALVQLTNLQTLYLDNNQLSEVPDALGQLTNLQTLYLDNNQLTWLPLALAETALSRVSIDGGLVGGLRLGSADRFPAGLVDAAEGGGIEQLWDYLRNNEPPADTEEVNEADDDIGSGFTIRDVVHDPLEFQALPDPATMLDVRGLLEQLVGLTTDLIHQGKFDHDPLVEDRIERDRDSLRYELFENPDIDATMIAIVTQRTLSAIIPVLDEGPQKELLKAIAGTPDWNPQSAEAAEGALDKAQEVADALDEQLGQAVELTEALEEIVNAPVQDGVTSSMWIAGALAWGAPVVEGLGLGATVTATVFALGATGPASVALGAVLGLLALFRPRG